jgi:hypothetical protein
MLRELCGLQKQELNNQPDSGASNKDNDGAGCGDEDVALRRRIGPILLEILMWR